MNIFILENIQHRKEITKDTTLTFIPEFAYDEPQRLATFTKKDLAMLGA